MKSDILLEAHNDEIRIDVEGDSVACMASLICIFKVLMDRGTFTLDELIHCLAMAVSMQIKTHQEQAEDIIADVFKDLRNK